MEVLAPGRACEPGAEQPPSWGRGLEGGGFGKVPWPRRCRSRPAALLGSLSFLFWAHTLEFHSTEGAAGGRAVYLPPGSFSACVLTCVRAFPQPSESLGEVAPSAPQDLIPS